MATQKAPVTTVQDLIDQLFDVHTEQRDGGLVSAASTTVQQFLRRNPSRIAFTFTNLGSSVVFIWSDATVSATRGLRAGPNGGSVSLLYDEDFSRTSFGWFCVAESGTPAVAVMEVLIGMGGTSA